MAKFSGPPPAEKRVTPAFSKHAPLEAPAVSGRRAAVLNGHGEGFGAAS
jgi:hypothetical protein